MNYKHKDDRFLMTAKALAAIWSKDPSSKVAAIAVGATDNQIAWGYNGFPPGIKDSEGRLRNREEKYAFTVHAEVNALANAKFDVKTLYVTHHPCSICALNILASRTVERVVYIVQEEFEERWKAELGTAKDLFKEAGVILDCVKFKGANE